MKDTRTYISETGVATIVGRASNKEQTILNNLYSSDFLLRLVLGTQGEVHFDGSSERRKVTENGPVRSNSPPSEEQLGESN